jgi:hypothetical protein
MTEQDAESNQKAKDQAEGLQKLREKFPDHLIGKLPKPTKTQTDLVKKDFKNGIRCDICGGWHHPKVVHLDYVGHASATDRLLDADIKWKWEPLALDDDNLPKFDTDGGLWVKLTVCDVTRLGYGSADGKKGGNAIKEAIGDAIRNAGMRFGIALDLWCKEDLHQDDDDGAGDNKTPKPPQKPGKPAKEYGKLADFITPMKKTKTLVELGTWYAENKFKANNELSKGDITSLTDQYEAWKLKVTPKESSPRTTGP